MNNHLTSSNPFQNILNRFLATNAETSEEVTWTCENCGIVPGKAITFREHVRYTKARCPCQIAEEERRERAERRQEWIKANVKHTYSWLSARFEDLALLTKTFENFDATKQPLAYQTVQAFVLHMKGTLVLHGGFGTGKTHLLAALCNEARQAEKASLFTTAPKLFAAIQMRIGYKEDYSSLLETAIRTPLLVIDDIDKAKHTEFREEIYFEIVDERVKKGLPIAISTNRLEDLENFVGGAVCSRFKIGQIEVEMIGHDYREDLEI